MTSLSATEASVNFTSATPQDMESSEYAIKPPSFADNVGTVFDNETSDHANKTFNGISTPINGSSASGNETTDSAIGSSASANETTAIGAHDPQSKAMRPLTEPTTMLEVELPTTSKGIPQIPIQNVYYPSWVLIVVVSAISCSIFITCTVVFVALYFVRRFKRQSILPKQSKIEFFQGTTTKNTTLSNVDNQHDYLMMKYNANKFEMEKNDFQFGKLDQKSILGQGNFGSVYKIMINRFNTEVAVKIPRDGCSRQTMQSLLCEIKIMSFVGDHENVIKFLGAYTKEIDTGVVFIATELCTMGSLQAYLRKLETNTKDNLSSTLPQLFRFCFEIASGMQFISEKGVIHGDLAARNVLLDSNAICKITDFGLSRKLYQYQIYITKQQEELPWRWLAIETLKRQEFSTKSDVWAYGVTLWEIFSFGDTPYPGISWTLSFIELLSSGMRLTKPKMVSQNVYNEMVDCWNPEPNCRPNFEELATFFSPLTIANQYANCGGTEIDYYNQPAIINSCV